MTRILLVEDEPAIATGVRDDLELEGYSVDVVGDGVTASTRGVQGQYDLILLDLMLPGKDGYTVCREIRAAGVRTPLLMLTARGQEADKVLGLELGADDYITKPFWPARAPVARPGSPAPEHHDHPHSGRGLRVRRPHDRLPAL